MVNTLFLTLKCSSPDLMLVVLAEAEAFFDEIGMNMTTGITCFLKKCLAAGEIPFKLGRHKRDKHAELLAALKESEEVINDPNAPRCKDLSRA